MPDLYGKSSPEFIKLEMSTTLPYNFGRFNLITKGGCLVAAQARGCRPDRSIISPQALDQASSNALECCLKSLFRLKFARHWLTRQAILVLGVKIRRLGAMTGQASF